MNVVLPVGTVAAVEKVCREAIHEDADPPPCSRCRMSAQLHADASIVASIRAVHKGTALVASVTVSD